MESLNRNQTWTLVDLSKDSKTIGCRWVFGKKPRLVAKRYAQKEGIGYNEIFFSYNQAYIYSDVIRDSSI